MRCLTYNVSNDLAAGLRSKLTELGRQLDAGMSLEEYQVSDASFPESALIDEGTLLIVFVDDLKSISVFLSALRLAIDGYPLAMAAIHAFPISGLLRLGEEEELQRLKAMTTTGQVLLMEMKPDVQEALVGFVENLLRSTQ